MKKQRKLNGGAKMGFLFALPAAIYMMVFIGYPMIQNLILSFKNVDVYSFAQPDNQVFVGLQNYIELFTSGNSILTKSIANTLIFTVGSIFFQFIIGFALALLFNKKFAGCSFFRGMTMISWAASGNSRRTSFQIHVRKFWRYYQPVPCISTYHRPANGMAFTSKVCNGSYHCSKHLDWYSV